MQTTERLIRYRRLLKRSLCSAHTVKNDMNLLSPFITWLQAPLLTVTHKELGFYVEHLLKTRRPKTINCHLGAIRAFFELCDR